MLQTSSLTPNQVKELEVLNYLQLPQTCYAVEANCRTITGVDIQESPTGLTPDDAYFAITGKGLKSMTVTDKVRLYQMIDAKRRRHRHTEWYEEGVMDGSNSYVTLLEGMSQPVAEYLAGEMFKGVDKKIIMTVYQTKGGYG